MATQKVKVDMRPPSKQDFGVTEYFLANFDLKGFPRKKAYAFEKEGQTYISIGGTTCRDMVVMPLEIFVAINKTVTESVL